MFSFTQFLIESEIAMKIMPVEGGSDFKRDEGIVVYKNRTIPPRQKTVLRTDDSRRRINNPEYLTIPDYNEDFSYKGNDEIDKLVFFALSGRASLTPEAFYRRDLDYDPTLEKTAKKYSDADNFQMVGHLLNDPYFADDLYHLLHLKDKHELPPTPEAIYLQNTRSEKRPAGPTADLEGWTNERYPGMSSEEREERRILRGLEREKENNK